MSFCEFSVVSLRCSSSQADVYPPLSLVAFGQPAAAPAAPASGGLFGSQPQQPAQASTFGGFGAAPKPAFSFGKLLSIKDKIEKGRRDRLDSFLPSELELTSPPFRFSCSCCSSTSAHLPLRLYFEPSCFFHPSLRSTPTATTFELSLWRSSASAATTPLLGSLWSSTSAASTTARRSLWINISTTAAADLVWIPISKPTSTAAAAAATTSPGNQPTRRSTQLVQPSRTLRTRKARGSIHRAKDRVR